MERPVRVSLMWVNRASRHQTSGSSLRENRACAISITASGALSTLHASLRRFFLPSALPHLPGRHGRQAYTEPGAEMLWIHVITESVNLSLTEISYLYKEESLIIKFPGVVASRQGLRDRGDAAAFCRGSGSARRRSLQGVPTPPGSQALPEE